LRWPLHKTDTPATLDPGHAQAEIGVLEYGIDRHAPDSLTIWNTEFKLGLSPRVDVEMFYAPISSPVGTHSKLSSDAAFRAKLQVFASDDEALLLTLVPYAEISHGELTAAGGFLFLGYDFASGIELELNVGDTVTLDTSEHALLATGAVTFPIAPSTSFFTELFTETALEAPRLDSTLDVGFLYVVARDVQVDAGVYIGLHGEVPTATPFLGTSLRL
jgi:hypothetical protein